MFWTAIRRAAQEPVPYIYRNQYKAKRLWPPDFTKLSSKYQFRLERRYKRRAKLKWARPKWTKAVKMVQMGSITFVLVYGVLFMDWASEGTQKQPFQDTRDWFWGLTGSVWTKDQVRRSALVDDASPSTDAKK